MTHVIRPKSRWVFSWHLRVQATSSSVSTSGGCWSLVTKSEHVCTIGPCARDHKEASCSYCLVFFHPAADQRQLCSSFIHFIMSLIQIRPEPPEVWIIQNLLLILCHWKDYQNASLKQVSKISLCSCRIQLLGKSRLLPSTFPSQLDIYDWGFFADRPADSWEAHWGR